MVLKNGYAVSIKPGDLIRTWTEKENEDDVYDAGWIIFDNIDFLAGYADALIRQVGSEVKMIPCAPYNNVRYSPVMFVIGRCAKRTPSGVHKYDVMLNGARVTVALGESVHVEFISIVGEDDKE